MDYSYWIALSNLEKLSNKEKFNLINKFKNVKEIFNSDFLNLKNNSNLISEKVKDILNTKIDYNATEKLYSKGINICCYDDDEYPKALKEIYAPPVVLYYKGKLPKNKCIAIVGSRKTTGYGRDNSFEIAKFLASKGLCIISGLARGIDSCSHLGALESGKTAAVLGSGINVCYPLENKYLMGRIEESGCVISEFPIDKRPSKYTFPSRNRIISGLSEAVIVVEAAEKSGSLITADFALDQGRDIFAFKNPPSELSKGTDKLISEGAIMIKDLDDFIKHFDL